MQSFIFQIQFFFLWCERSLLKVATVVFSKIKTNISYFVGSPAKVLNTKTEQVYAGIIISISDKKLKISATNTNIKLNYTNEEAQHDTNTETKFQFL